MDQANRANRFYSGARRRSMAAALVLACAPSFWAPDIVAAQTPAAEAPAGVPPTFSEAVDVQVINVDVTVSDRRGQPIAGLVQEDFELVVDGKPVPISNFYAETGGFVGELVDRTERSVPQDPSFRTVEEVQAESPRKAHVVLLIDHSRLRTANRKRAFKSLRETLTKFNSEDLIAVVGIEGGLVFYSDFLYDRQAVGRILDQLEGVTMSGDLNEIDRRLIFGELARGMSGGIQARASQADEGAIRSRIRAYAQEEYERGVRSMKQIETVVSTLSGLEGRKALIYVGEGIPSRPGEGLFVEWRNRFGQGNSNAGIGLRRFDFNTDYTREIGRFDLNQQMQMLAKSANRAEVTLYAVDAEGDHGGIVRSALTEQGATSETLSVIDENFRAPLEAAAKATGGRLLRSSGFLSEQLLDVVGELATFYSIGFKAPEGWEAGTEHDVKVKVKGPKLVVRHREEVRLPKPDEVEASATIAALMYQGASNPLGVRATAGDTFEREDGNAALRIDIEVPLAQLGFLPQVETQSGSLSIYIATKDSEGNPGKVQKIPFHLAIPKEALEEAIADNAAAKYPLPLILRPGDQQVAIGIRDNVNRVFSAVRLEVAEHSKF